MPWTLRPCGHFSRGTSRSFSLTAIWRQPRELPVHIARKLSPHSVPLEEVPPAPSFAGAVKFPPIRNQILFATLGSLFVYGVAARQANEDTYYWTNRIIESSPSLSWAFTSPTNKVMSRYRTEVMFANVTSYITKYLDVVRRAPRDIADLMTDGLWRVAAKWLEGTDGYRVCVTVGTLNGLVYLAWLVPRFSPFLMKNFAHNPLSGKSYTMLTCIFSHSGFIHYLFNTMALSSFGTAASAYLMKTQQQDPSKLREATGTWHFLAFFLSAGLFSSLVSHVAHARIVYPAVLRRLASSTTATAVTKVTDVIKPSVGASGAIYAAVTMSALAYPDLQVKLIFPPTPPIDIQYGVAAFVALDIIGILRGWKLFDHYAHFGGAMFGVWYYHYGPRLWEFARETTLGSLPPSLRK